MVVILLPGTFKAALFTGRWEWYHSPRALWMGDTLVKQWETRLILKNTSCCFVPRSSASPQKKYFLSA